MKRKTGAQPSLPHMRAPDGVPRIESIRVKNYRALRAVKLDGITALTALLGRNGSGKSTVFDAFSFLSECFEGADGLRKAIDKRGHFRELRTRGEQGTISFEIVYRETAKQEPATYTLEIDERDGRPIVTQESLSWRRVAQNKPGAPYKILSFREGKGWVIAGERPGKDDRKIKEKLDEPHRLAVNTFGQLTRHPRVAALRRFISDWYVSYLSVDDARGTPEAGPHERLTRTGDNLANVIQHLQERHPERLELIFRKMSQRVPRLERVDSEPLADGRLLLRVKDAPFTDPVLARFASDGTLKMLAYLVVLHDPTPPPFIGVEEPENFLHPRLLLELAEECREASERAQILVTTHSPQFVDGLRPEEVRVLSRDAQGHTQLSRASEIRGVKEFIAEGASLGDLWLEGHLSNEVA